VAWPRSSSCPIIPASPRMPLTYLLVLIRPLITPEIASQKSSAKARKGGTSVIEGKVRDPQSTRPTWC
jgi:hypothetical protein